MAIQRSDSIGRRFAKPRVGTYLNRTTRRRHLPKQCPCYAVRGGGVLDKNFLGVVALVISVGPLAACSGATGDEPADNVGGKDGGGGKSDSSASSKGDAAKGGATSDASADAAVTACAATFTIENVAFYGSGSESAGASSCPAITPPYAWLTYTSESSGQASPTVSLTSSTGVLTVATSLTASPDGGAAYGLAGLGFDGASCANGSAYTGISFDLNGTLGGCALQFQIEDSENSTPAENPGVGQCTASKCASPYTWITQTGTMMVPFSALAGGAPRATVDSTTIVSIEWVVLLLP